MALAELWGLMGVAEDALLVVSACVVVVGLFGMLAVLLTGLNERRRELAILRSVGARPGHLFGLILGEALCLTGIGIALGLGLLYLLLGPGQAAGGGALRDPPGARWPIGLRVLALGGGGPGRCPGGGHPGLAGLSLVPDRWALAAGLGDNRQPSSLSCLASQCRPSPILSLP